jgi:uncharacterized protein YqeY
MDTKTQLETALKESLRSGDEVRKRTVRMALAAIKQIEIDKRISLDEPAVIAIIQKEVKTRRESIEESQKANRPDLIFELEAEIAVLTAFLPTAMSSEDLNKLVNEAITEVGASGPTDMGKVMKVLLPRVAGRSPNDQVSAAVRQQLQK